MNKILLLLEDYSELTFIQILLKKLGFDVDAIQNPHAMADRLMVFRPNVIIAPEDGRRIRREMIAPQLALIPSIKQILLSTHGSGNAPVEENVFRIKSPIQPMDLIHALATACQMDPDNLAEKYQKFRRQIHTEELGDIVYGNFGFDSEVLAPDQEVSRKKRYDEFLAKAGDSVSAIFSPKEVAKENKSRRGEGTSSSIQDTLDVDRQSFTKKLFSKKG